MHQETKWLLLMYILVYNNIGRFCPFLQAHFLFSEILQRINKFLLIVQDIEPWGTEHISSPDTTNH